MKLGNFLTTVGTAKPVVPRPVNIKLVGKGPTGVDVTAPATAVMILVDEDTRQGVRVAVRETLAAKFPGKDFSDAISDEMSYQLLYCALRESTPNGAGLYGSFAESVQELRQSLVVNEAQRLMATYNAYMDEEFPEVISASTFSGAGDGSPAGVSKPAG